MSKEVVIIDDEEINLDLAENILSNLKELEGHNIITFNNPKEALEYCKKNPNIKIILIDQHMPDLTGIEFIEEYNKSVSDISRASIIMISSDDSSEVVARALEVGIDDHFTKPFDPVVMHARICNSISKNILRHEIHESKKIKEILLRVLIHDVASSLGIAMYNSQIINREQPSERYKNVEFSLSSINEILTSIRAIEANELNKSNIALEKKFILKILDDSISNVSHRAEKKNIEIMVHNESGENFEIYTDPSILKYQIISNLLTNAIKFSAAGSTIDVFIKGNNDNVALIIQDHGMGMPKKILENVFKWDVKTSRVGTDKEKGTGFGMPIVKRFVEILGHSIDIESWEEESEGHEKGTKVTLSFFKNTNN